jgi:uracil-DNA glycosylase family 4
MPSDLDIQRRLERIWSEYEANPRLASQGAWKTPRCSLVPGEGSVRPKLVVVGEAPGADEDRTGRPFCGQSGSLLRHELKKIGLTAEDWYITNVVKFRPPGNATPPLRDVLDSAPYLQRELAALEPQSPKMVMPVGAVALSVFDPISRISHVAGRTMGAKNGWTAFPMFHPAYILRNGSKARERYSESFAELKAMMDEIVLSEEMYGDNVASI